MGDTWARVFLSLGAPSPTQPGIPDKLSGLGITPAPGDLLAGAD